MLPPTRTIQILNISFVHPATRVALDIHGHAHNIMKPQRGQKQRVSSLEDHLVPCSMLKGRKFLQIRMRPVHSRVTSAGMSIGKECHVSTLPWVGQDVSAFSTQNRDKVSFSIKVVGGHDTFHSETTEECFRGLKSPHGGFRERFLDVQTGFCLGEKG